MNKSTLLSFALAATVTVPAFAQESQSADGKPKTFGGASQFRTWSIGINAGVMAPVALIGGTNDYNNWDANFGYGAFIKKQISPAFALKADFNGGKLSGSTESAAPTSFSTDVNYATSLKAHVDLTNMFLKRENKVALFFEAGYGIMGFDAGAGSRTEQFIPAGAGLKFKLSERIAANLGYTMNFVDADNLDGSFANATSKDKYSYGYGGLEFSLGKTSKQNLDWANPVALMYDELKDDELRKEVAAIKTRVTASEGEISNMKKDTDGDGVSDAFDKEPATPAGNIVDGAGRTIVFPKDTVTVDPTNKNIIQFDFNSDKLRSESLPAIKTLASELIAQNAKLIIEGHASIEGTEAYNMNLSKRRANSAKKALVKAGVKSSNISTVGYGETRPIASNDTEEGRQKNRRVEFKMQ
ncbi:OmpA family protein [Solitalea koreensis]|uniref:OmpA-OmpF porin, OOP family n=1 Tax=Solitalea koreensis TaxID=543615 RepID=A0A521BXV9_9SPHI|nr:OmpA family protein [Solitalea koreensis]SMO52018.1 OmpA-OmpF porin, OOP family [Solitalea koreensis]